MTRFKRLTDAEARTLIRAELLDRIEAESADWDRRPPETDEDWAAYREFGRIMHEYMIRPARLEGSAKPAGGAAVRAAGRPEPPEARC